MSTPNDFANLAAWYRFNTGLTLVNGLVSQWNDQSGNGRHLVQATVTNRPAYQGDGTILFDGVDNYLKASAFTLAQPETVYLLGRQVTWTGSDYIFDGNTASTMAIFNETSSPTINTDVSGSSGANSDWALGVDAVVCVVFNGASSLIQVNNNAAVTGTIGVGSGSGFTLGARGNNLSFAHIQVKEVLLYSVAHDADTRNQLIQYLQDVDAGRRDRWPHYRQSRGRR